MKRLLILLVLLIPVQATAADWDFDRWNFKDWNKKDKTLEITWQIAHAADFILTERALDRPGIRELNPIMGPQPSEGQLLGWWAIFALAHYIVTPLMPEDVWYGRPLWHWVGIGSKVFVIHSNANLIRW